MDHPTSMSSSTPLSAPVAVSGVSDAIHDTVHLATASATNLASEPAAYLSGLAHDIADAAGRLINCRTPFDVLAVQQSYAMARGTAWLDSAYRCFERCVADDGLQQGPGRLALPE